MARACPWCGQFHPHTNHNCCSVRDDLAIAHATGRIDRRNGRARRVDLADRGRIAAAYHAGYDGPVVVTGAGDAPLVSAPVAPPAAEGRPSHHAPARGRLRVAVTGPGQGTRAQES